MNAWKLAGQRTVVVATVVGTALLGGCNSQHVVSSTSSVPLHGAYVEHTTGKSYALVFDGTQVSAWMYYPSGGPITQSNTYKVCLAKGAKYTVSGDAIEISGSNVTSAGDRTAPFPVPGSGSNITLQMLGHGVVLQVPLISGGNLKFVKSS